MKTLNLPIKTHPQRIAVSKKLEALADKDYGERVRVGPYTLDKTPQALREGARLIRRKQPDRGVCPTPPPPESVKIDYLTKYAGGEAALVAMLERQLAPYHVLGENQGDETVEGLDPTVYKRTTKALATLKRGHDLWPKKIQDQTWDEKARRYLNITVSGYEISADTFDKFRDALGIGPSRPYGLRSRTEHLTQAQVKTLQEKGFILNIYS